MFFNAEGPGSFLKLLWELIQRTGQILAKGQPSLWATWVGAVLRQALLAKVFSSNGALPACSYFRVWSKLSWKAMLWETWLHSNYIFSYTATGILEIGLKVEQQPALYVQFGSSSLGQCLPLWAHELLLKPEGRFSQTNPARREVLYPKFLLKKCSNLAASGHKDLGHCNTGDWATCLWWPFLWICQKAWKWVEKYPCELEDGFTSFSVYNSKPPWAFAQFFSWWLQLDENRKQKKLQSFCPESGIFF